MNSRLCIVCLLIALPFVSFASQDNHPIALTQAGDASITMSTSRQIIVISDLHLGEGKDTNTGLWYPMEDFRWPKQFAQFLEKIDLDGKNKTDLIVNGDLFDLWQSQTNDCQYKQNKNFGCTEEESLSRLERVVKAHQIELQALGKFVMNKENRLIIIPGNHDAALLFPTVKEAALQAIDGGENVYFAPSGYWISEDNLIYIEHGHQIGREVNKWDQWPSPFLEKEGKRYLQRPWGEQFVQDYYNRFEDKFPIIDNISSESEGVQYAIAAEGSQRTIRDVAGLLNFYFFGVSWNQFKASLGEEKEGSPPEWDIKTIRNQGPRFLSESLPSDHPFYSDVREPKNEQVKEQIVEMFKKLSDEDIKTICDKRALLVEKQEKQEKITITRCPQTNGQLGAITQTIFRSGEKVLGEHLEKVVCPSIKGCEDQPFKVFIYGHTHLSIRPWELSLSRGNWKPMIINSGAWQRVVTPEQVNAIRDRKSLPKEEVLPKLLPEDLPPCYSYVLIKPYSKENRPTPLLRYWVGEEGQKGKPKNQCGL